MIDNWFKKDIEKIYASHDIVVFVDESKEAHFLVDTIKNDATIITTSNEIEELKAKYEIEKATAGGKFFIYTTTPKNDLKFIREYCETNGCIEIKYLESYVKQKVKLHLNLNINLPKEELLSAAKVSVGKTQTYWMDLCHKGAAEIFDLEKELLPFLDNPKSFLKKFDTGTQEIFLKKVNELINQAYVKKPINTLASEVVVVMFDSLADNKPDSTLLSVYETWIDSLSYKASFQDYLSRYKLKQKADIFSIHPSHPFRAIDELWLTDIAHKINDNRFIGSILPKINQRTVNKAALSLGITFWTNIKVLLEFDEKNISQLSTFKECVDFYITSFSKVDGAIRKLYAEFLSNSILIEPIQLYYENLSTIFLDKWFSFSDNYVSNQTGKIQEILDKNPERTAIVVGDGVSWEFSKDIISRITNRDIKLSSDYIFAGLPSETEHNMSQLYVSTGEVLPTKKAREKYLADSNTDKEIGFVDLDSVNELTDKQHYLICSCKDPDKLGETYQQKALKYFDNVADTYANKIQQLLRNGYKNVFLVTDHGFTLTGILENSNKIEVNFTGDVNKSERYIRTNEKQEIDSNLLMEKELSYKDSNYCYFAKRTGPFKTPGVYGFSHGGLAPQETIIPYLKWTNEAESTDLLDVSIVNKQGLKEVTGDLFSVKLKGTSSSKDLFSNERKVILMFFSNGAKYNESDIITLENELVVKKEYHFGGNTEIEIKVLDALTKVQLDKVIVKQSTARDLGGL